MKIWRCPATVKVLLSVIPRVRMPADYLNISFFLDLRGTDYAISAQHCSPLFTLQNLVETNCLLLIETEIIYS